MSRLSANFGSWRKPLFAFAADAILRDVVNCQRSTPKLREGRQRPGKEDSKVNCRCPKCQALFDARSPSFGSQSVCPLCGGRFELDIFHIAHFELPRTIHVRLVDKSGLPIRLPQVIVLVSYGYNFPPLQTDDTGCVTVTAEMFHKAEADEVLTGIMDHKGDYTLLRYVTIRVPSAEELEVMGRLRKQSVWPMLPFEREIYGNRDRLCRVYAHNRNARVRPTTVRLDLAQAEGALDVPLSVAENVIA